MGQHRARKQAEGQEQMAYDAGVQDTQTSAAAPPSAGLTSEDTARLTDLGRLHDQGILTDEEFAQQKARILGI